MRNIFITALAIFILSCNSKKNNPLGLYLEKGKTYSQVVSSKSHISQSINGQQMDMEMQVKGSMSFLVKSVSDSGYAMEAKYDSLGMTMTSQTGAMEFSSEKTGEDPFTKMLAAIKNKPFTLTMSRTGKISNVANVNSIFEAAVNAVTNSGSPMNDMQKEQIKSQLMKAYGAEALAGNMEMVTAIFPGRSVKKGDNWTIDTKLESIMPANLSTKYTWAEEKDDYVLIKGDAKIVTADTTAVIESGGIPMKLNINGTMVSDIKLDPKTGWIIESVIKQNMEGYSLIPQSPQIPQGMKIPITVKSDINIRNK